MRRSGHPSRPRAMTCCFFASLKTLLISTKATALRRNQRPRASSSLAGFEVTLIGRFWVTPEGGRYPLAFQLLQPSQFIYIGRHVLKQLPLGKCLNGSLICAVRGSIDARTPTRGELPLLHPPYARVFAGYCSAQPQRVAALL